MAPHRPRKWWPEVQTLEGRTLLSAMTMAKIAESALVSAMAAFQSKGTISGGFRLQNSSISLTGLTGSMKSTGGLKGGGSLSLAGPVVSGGTVTLKNKPANKKAGTLTLQVISGVTLPMQKVAKFDLSLKVVGATGAYSSALNRVLAAHIKLQATTATRGAFSATFS